MTDLRRLLIPARHDHSVNRWIDYRYARRRRHGLILCEGMEKRRL